MEIVDEGNHIVGKWQTTLRLRTYSESSTLFAHHPASLIVRTTFSYSASTIYIAFFAFCFLHCAMAVKFNDFNFDAKTVC